MINNDNKLSVMTFIDAEQPGNHHHLTKWLPSTGIFFGDAAFEDRLATYDISGTFTNDTYLVTSTDVPL